MKPRPYQLACLQASREHLHRHGATLAVLATGMGKTVIFAHLARDWPGRVLVLAHRDELIRQAAEKLHTITGTQPGIEMGAEKVEDQHTQPPRIVVSSVQTMCRPPRQRKFNPADFGLLIIDEAHHAVARTYTDVIGYFRQNPSLKLYGTTATPKRTDELAMGQVFDSVAFDYGIEPAIEDGWLVPIRQQAIVVDGLDFSRVRSVQGDLAEDELEQILSEEKILHATAAPTIQMVGDLPAIVFCVGVNHAKLLAAVLCRYKKQSAIAVDGKTPRDIRADTIAAFKSGQVQYLCNCALYLEGFDAPHTAAIVMARPTKSLALYTQLLGRGTRPLPGVVDGLETAQQRKGAIAASTKPSMLVLDFVGNSGRHKIIHATDLLGGKYAQPVREYARKTIEEEGCAALIDESLERAADELALLAEIAERKRREHIKAQAEYLARTVSPFGRDRGASTFSSSVPPTAVSATPKQVWYLVFRAGWTREQACRLSKRQASAIIAKLQGGMR